MDNFKYDYFWDVKRDISVKKKIFKEGKLNCSSNELVHPILQEINTEFLKKIDIEKNNSYIFYPKKQQKFSALLNIPVKNLQLYAGSDDAIKYILTAFSKKCCNLIIQMPNYENYICYAELNKYNIVEWQVQEKGHFDINEGVKLIENNNTSIIVLTIPNGITGTIMRKEEMDKVINDAYKKNDIVIIDQTYAPFSSIDYSSYYQEKENVIVISSCSKGLGLAGARFAYVSASEIIIDYLSKWNGINAISAITYQMAEYYLKEDRLKDVINEVTIVRKDFIEYIRLISDWEVIDSHANFVLIKLFSAEEVKQLYDYFLNNNIIIKIFSDESLKKYVRITIVNTEKMNKIKDIIYDFIYNNSNTIRKC